MLDEWEMDAFAGIALRREHHAEIGLDESPGMALAMVRDPLQ